VPHRAPVDHRRVPPPRKTCSLHSAGARPRGPATVAIGGPLTPSPPTTLEESGEIRRIANTAGPRRADEAHPPSRHAPLGATVSRVGCVDLPLTTCGALALETQAQRPDYARCSEGLHELRLRARTVLALHPCSRANRNGALDPQTPDHCCILRDRLAPIPTQGLWRTGPGPVVTSLPSQPTTAARPSPAARTRVPRRGMEPQVRVRALNSAMAFDDKAITAVPAQPITPCRDPVATVRCAVGGPPGRVRESGSLQFPAHARPSSRIVPPGPLSLRPASLRPPPPIFRLDVPPPLHGVHGVQPRRFGIETGRSARSVVPRRTQLAA